LSQNKDPEKTAETLQLTEIIRTWPDRMSRAGKTLSQAANESGLKKGQLSQYINFKNSPTIKPFEAFENYLRGLGV